MSFERSWVALLALVPLLWTAYEWRRTSRRLALALKALSLSAILLALASPRLDFQSSKVAVALLADTSGSSSAADLGRASQISDSFSSAQGSNWLRVIPFARGTRPLDPSENQNPWSLKNTAGEAGRATDIEAAIREGVASLPSGFVPRVVLVSDGKENQGSLVRAAWQARQLGVPIYTYPLPGRAKPPLRLDSFSIPAVAFAGERFPIDLLVSSPKAVTAEIELSAEGRTLGKTQLPLGPGATPVRMHASLDTAGAVDLSVTIRSQEPGELRLDQAIRLRRPKALYITQDPPNVDAHLPNALAAAQFDVDRATDFANHKLTAYQLVVVNNFNLESLRATQKADVEAYVKQGGGLLVLAGERNVYIEGKTVEDALDRTLPAKLAPPRSPEGTALVLIVDKSSSMEGRKIDLARSAAAGVVENLRPVDMVGVLIFDNTFQWAVTMRRAEDRTMIKRLIAGITPDGGTQIAPALTEAFHRIDPVTATYKHIVLLTDGISEEGDSMELARSASQKLVTISTVGLGMDVNRGYLERVATTGGGKSYFLNDPSGLEQILLKDVMEHSGSTSVEKSLPAEVVHNAEILEGVGMESAPKLKGYVRYIAKPSAETILQIDRKEPLLTRWQYGLGRAAVWTSDAKPRWAADWVNWKGYDTFWTNVSRDLLPHAQAGEASVEYDSANGDLVANYRLGRDVEEPAKLPAIFAMGPDGFQKPVLVKKIAAGTFRGRVQIGSRQGLFRVRPLEESSAFPETGLYRPEAEFADYGVDEELLKQVAGFTGGRYQPTAAQVFDAGKQSTPSSMKLWPGLLGAAIMLSLAELVMRKWKGVISS